MSKVDDKYFNFFPDDCTYVYNDKDTNVHNAVSYMLNRSSIMFQYKGLPSTIPYLELEKRLQITGSAVFFAYNGNYYVTENFTETGDKDIYNHFNKINVNIPQCNINQTYSVKDAIIIQNDSNCMGLLPIYNKYCTLMTENEITMLLYDVNTRVQSIISASDNRTIESANMFFKKLFNGEFSVIGDEQLFNSLKIFNKMNSATVIKDLVEYEQYLKGSMFNEIGLSANYNMKKERLTNADVELNTDNLYPLVDDMLANRRNALNLINERYGLSITVELNSAWDYRVGSGEKISLDEPEKPDEPEEPEQKGDSDGKDENI